MSDDHQVTSEEIDSRYDRLARDAGESGYNLNPDTEFTKELVSGLLVNERRYGNPTCPCRLAEGTEAADLDIICPCDYRDPDLDEYGACYCALYVSREVADGVKSAQRIPDRRPVPGEVTATEEGPQKMTTATVAYPVWRCKVCGYLCARDTPPEVCPICKAQKKRFEQFM
jgi:ferredoxin-thioredoxin reductase catalytic chain